MRGLAVVIMIQSHTFHSLVRSDLRQGDAYLLSQFVGGMAAPLFLFMAGMTLAFQMDRLSSRGGTRSRRCLAALRRGAFVLGLAYLFRSGSLTRGIWGTPDWAEFTKVDILNCMGVAMMAFAAAAVWGPRGRIRFALAGGLAIAMAAPVVSNLNWANTPALLRDYLVPRSGTGHFPFFPCASYIGFGLAAGTIVKQTGEERFERLMQWSVLIGFGLIWGALYFANLPYSIYTRSDFWVNSPALILIRVGVCLLLVVAAYLWTERFAGPGWSWMRCLGMNSLMVYWVHVQLVYSDLFKLKQALNIPQTIAATLVVIALMLALSEAWLRWKGWRAGVRAQRVGLQTP
jgi:uncharacterized membrane protein